MSRCAWPVPPAHTCRDVNLCPCTPIPTSTASVNRARAERAANPGRGPHLSKMAPTPALWALFRWTCSPVARRIPSFTAMDRWEKEAMSSSFQPGGRRVHGHAAVSLPPMGLPPSPPQAARCCRTPTAGSVGPTPTSVCRRNEAPEHLCSGNASSFWVQTRAIKALRSPAHEHPLQLCLMQVLPNPMCPGRCLPTRAGRSCHGAAAANLVQAANSPVMACHVGRHKIVNY